MRLLVIDNFTDEAIDALQYANDVAKLSGSHQLYVEHLHPIDIKDRVMSSSKLRNQDRKEREEYAKHTLAERVNKYVDHSINTQIIVLDKSLKSGLLSSIKKHQITCVVMPVNINKQSSGSWLNSAFETIMKNISVPILVCKSYSSLTAIKDVLLVSDLENSDEKLLSDIDQKVFLQNKTVHVGYIKDNLFLSESEIENALKSMTEKYNLKNYKLHIEEDSSVINGIENLAKKTKADIILLKYYSRTFLEKIVIGTTVEKVIEDTDVPVLTENVST